MTTHVRLVFAAGLCVLGAGIQVDADSATATIAVSANVKRNCTIISQPLAYGGYDPVAVNATSPLDATATVTLTCTKGTTATIGLDRGTNAQGTVRRMRNGPVAYLTYELYQDSSHSTVWTNIGGGILDVGSAPSKQPRPFTVYGRIAGGQDASVGYYTDSIVATVNF